MQKWESTAIFKNQIAPLKREARAKMNLIASKKAQPCGCASSNLY